MRRSEARQEFFLASGGRRLACVYVPGRDDGPAVLLCHGIGETVEHWSAVQALFADHGIGSLVFNYTGFGRSSGRVSVAHCGEDLVTAYGELRRRVGFEARVFCLGYSLGSGIATEGVAGLRPAVAGLFLCEAFTSFREAGAAAGVPGWLMRRVPEVWRTTETVGLLEMPVCVVHSDGDRLFPVAMAREIVGRCGGEAELIVVKGLTHNEPYRTAAAAYWEPIMERVLGSRP